jgi:CBS domain-containing protein
VAPRTTVEEAAALVATHGFAALPVVGENGAVVGVVSREDLLAALTPQDEVSAARVSKFVV